MSPESADPNTQVCKNLRQQRYDTGPLTGPENPRTVNSSGLTLTYLEGGGVVGIAGYPPDSDFRLREIIDRWPALPEDARQAIARIVSEWSKD